MKQIILKLIITILIVIGNYCLAQNNQVPVFTPDPNWEENMNSLNGNFYNIVNNAEAEGIISSNTSGEDEASELAKWYSFWVNRVDGPNAPSGSFDNIKMAYQGLLSNPICQNVSNGANWHYAAATSDNIPPGAPTLKYQLMGIL